MLKQYRQKRPNTPKSLQSPHESQAENQILKINSQRENSWNYQKITTKSLAPQCPTSTTSLNNQRAPELDPIDWKKIGTKTTTTARAYQAHPAATIPLWHIMKLPKYHSKISPTDEYRYSIRLVPRWRCAWPSGCLKHNRNATNSHWLTQEIQIRVSLSQRTSGTRAQQPPNNENHPATTGPARFQCAIMWIWASWELYMKYGLCFPAD